MCAPLHLRDVRSYTIASDEALPSKRAHVLANPLPSGCRIVWEYRYLHHQFRIHGMSGLRWKWWRRLSPRVSSTISPSEIYLPSLLEGHAKFGTVSTLGMMVALELQMDAINHKTSHTIKSTCVRYLVTMSSRAVEAIRESHPEGIEVEVGGKSISVAPNGAIAKFDELVHDDDSCAALMRTQWALLMTDGLYGISCRVSSCLRGVVSLNTMLGNI